MVCLARTTSFARCVLGLVIRWIGKPALEPTPFRYFEPWRGRGHVELSTARTDLTLQSVHRQMLPRLSPDGVSVPRIEGKAYMLAFFKRERSRVQ
jgi:hypothetical protein